MHLVTRCPACRALFEVRERQLQACEGWLRCGQCFNAFDSAGLVLPWAPVPVSLPADASSAARVDIRSLLRQPERPVAQAAPAAGASGASGAIAPVFDPVFRQLVPDSLELGEPALPAAPGLGGSPPSTASQALPTLSPLVSPSSAHVPANASVRPANHSRWPWALACTLAFVGLLGQALYLQRDPVQLAVPALQGLGQQLCLTLGCPWPAVRAPSALQLDSARLLREPQGLMLRLRVRNMAGVDVVMGALDLTLLGPDASVLVRRVLSPTDLGAPAELRAGAVWEGAVHLQPHEQLENAAQVQGYRAVIFLP